MDDAYLQERITVTKSIIAAYEAAVLALVDGSMQSYTIDTGQTRQTVTKFDVPRLNSQLDILYNRLATLCARAGTPGGVRIVAPAW